MTKEEKNKFVRFGNFGFEQVWKESFYEDDPLLESWKKIIKKG